MADAIQTGVIEAEPEADVTVVPLADGGDGTIQALHAALGGTIHKANVTGPIGQKAEASWLKLSLAEGEMNSSLWDPIEGPVETCVGAPVGDPAGASVEGSAGERLGAASDALFPQPYPMQFSRRELAVVELASACGIAYLRGYQLHPLDSHTVGLGEVLLTAMSHVNGQVIVAVGGSASTDGGVGALTAIGAQFLDRDGTPLPLGGLSLVDLCSVDLSCVSRHILDRLVGGSLKVLADVTNPLLGVDGAAFVFGPQKGANHEQVMLLEQGLTRLADLLEVETGRCMRNVVGAGAAGGAAFGLACVLEAEIISGFQWIADAVQLDNKIAQCDLVISAEGKLDHQSFSGKAIGELAKLCHKHDRALFVMPAVLDPGLDWRQFGIADVVPAATCGTVATVADVVKVSKDLMFRVGTTFKT